MGQQQILLIVLGMIIIGIAVAISIALFRSNAIESKRDILIEETTSLGTMALQYYKKPKAIGGGGTSFTGWEIPPQMHQTINGNFMIANVQADEVFIVGTGSEVVTGVDSIKVRTYVSADSMYTEILN